MARKALEKSKGRREGGTFAALPHVVFRARGDEPAPAGRLGKLARLLLVDLAMQLNGNNNGNLTAAPKTLAPYGWNSRGTLADALAELVREGFLELTRQGGRNRCSLFAVTWLGIDEGPHDARPNPVASHLWKPENAPRREVRGHPQNENSSRLADKPSRLADKSGAATCQTTP